MAIFKEKIITLSGTLLYGFFFLAVYLLNRSVPLTDIYLGRDRITHVIVVFFSGVIGIVILLLLKKFKGPKVIRFLEYGLSFIFILGIPALLFYTEYQSFRGTEWAIETFFIGLVPILFFYAAFLVLFNNRIVNLFLTFFFVFFSIYHLLLLLKVFRSVGRAFSSTGSLDIFIMLVLIVSSALFAYFSFKHYLKLKE